ncbi:MAG: endonuclease/exonuclease/phosphatase family protein [Saprospiraceae bacterium]|nr:endonuclease/exonuclease/phosphatase family protein [Saprospiraceae bacterium]
MISVTLLIYVVPYLNPNYAGWFSILGLFYPILLVLNIGFLLFWLYRKKFTLAIATSICIILGWNYLTSTFGINYFSPLSINAENELRIMTYNVRNFPIEGKWDNDRWRSKIEKTLLVSTAYLPDIFCGQEFKFPANIDWYDDMVVKLLGENRHIATNKSELIIVSKFPIINSESVKVMDNDEKSRNCFFADVQINNNLIVRVYNIHLESNKVSSQTENMELDTETLQEKSTWKTMYSVFGSIRNNQKLRATQIDNIVTHIQGSPYPVIVCGDFNDTPLSYTYKTINGLLQDNFVKKGRGSGTTYNGNIPFLKIDYILSDNRFNVLETKILKRYDDSDHFPIFSRISW